MEKCPLCNAPLIKKEVVLDYDFKYASVQCTVWAQECSDCKEQILDGKSRESAELSVARILYQEEIIAGDTFRHFRKVLGYSRKQAAEICDVTPETISRWENETEHYSLPIVNWKHFGILCMMPEHLRSHRERRCSANSKKEKVVLRIDAEHRSELV